MTRARVNSVTPEESGPERLFLTFLEESPIPREGGEKSRIVTFVAFRHFPRVKPWYSGPLLRHFPHFLDQPGPDTHVIQA